MTREPFLARNRPGTSCVEDDEVRIGPALLNRMQHLPRLQRRSRIGSIALGSFRVGVPGNHREVLHGHDGNMIARLPRLWPRPRERR